MKKIFKILLIAGLFILVILPITPSIHATAETVSGNDADEKASKDTKNKYYTRLVNYKSNLYIANDVTKETKDKVEKLYASANAYIANYDITESDLAAYVSSIESQMASIVSAQKSDKAPTTKEFLAVGDNYTTPVAQHGKEVAVTLPIINLGTENITNIVVTPVTSNTIKEWPFQLDKSSYAQIIDVLPASTNKEIAMINRREVSYVFKTREDVLSGYYKLDFSLTYTINGAIETATLSTYVNTVGAPGSGSIDQTSGEDATKTSTPRIIVTGFETNPAVVYAGSTFTLNIHVKNTSQRTAVSNVEFDLEAAVEGKDENATYSAFLPTSGSNTVYIDKIPQGGKADLSIEMTAKADLSQKPYVLNIKMKYEDEKYNPYDSTASVSIPVNQISKFESSSPEITPSEIYVGEQSNVMFSIYNTGKTTLYNTKVSFKGDSVEGGDTFVGKIESGATGNVDAMLTGKAATMDDGTIIATISYEDASGNVTTEEKEITLLVSEGFEDPGMGEMPVPEEEAKNYTGIIVLSVIAVIIILVIIVIVIKKKKKKQKEAKELADDLLGIEDENS